MKAFLSSLLALAAVTIHAQVITVPNDTRTEEVVGDLPVELVAYLYGANVVPSSGVEGMGVGSFFLEGTTLEYSIKIPYGSFVPTTGGFFGPASRGMNGNLILALEPFIFERNTPNSPPPVGWYVSSGKIIVSWEQSGEIRAGLWYVMVFSEQALNSVIRGQVCPLTPDEDCDDDGVANKHDLYPNTPPGLAVDSQGGRIAELCPCLGTIITEEGTVLSRWRNHSDYVNCVKKQAARFFKERIIRAKERNRIVKEARESDCGKPPPRPIFRPY